MNLFLASLVSSAEGDKFHKLILNLSGVSSLRPGMQLGWKLAGLLLSEYSWKLAIAIFSFDFMLALLQGWVGFDVFSSLILILIKLSYFIF